MAHYLVGSLAINMYDRKHKRPVWHGTATQHTLERDLGEEHAKRVVQRLMARFPPEG